MRRVTEWAAGWDTDRHFVISSDTLRDFVNVQKALLDSLGIKKPHAVAGASMGALQAFELNAPSPRRFQATAATWMAFSPWPRSARRSASS